LGHSSKEDIVAKLKTKNIVTPGHLSDMNPLVKVLWTLSITENNTDISEIDAETISHILLKIARINLSEEAVRNALARADDKIKRNHFGLEIFYEIMSTGKEFLEISLGSQTNSVMFFSGSTPWSDLNKRFPEILKMMEGEICIIDSWYGIGTFYTLEKFGKTRSIRMLTGQLGREEQQNMTKFTTELNKFKKEFNNINLKSYGAWWELHDRYMLSDNAIFIVGHGIKDIGTKESFGILVSKDTAGDLLTELKRRFEEKWAKAKNI